ncbi:MAG TPA: FkbM family methyltransferase [Planctomycetota bacterium]|nr:FkbM family methyltransferase [Planctomycetota bacterium]
MKALIKKAARSLGLQISRYPPPPGSTDLYGNWLDQLRHDASPSVIFDVGANRGSAALRFRSEFPNSTVFAFEPGHTAFDELKHKVAADQSIKPFQVALGEHDGSATLHQNVFDLTNSLLPNSGRINQYSPSGTCTPVGTCQTPVMRLDTFCSREAIRRIDLLKIDTQGYERQVLAGAGDLLQPETVRGLFLEVLFVDLYEGQTWCGEVMELLRSRGYRFFGFTGVAFDQTNGWKWADAMFIGDK